MTDRASVVYVLPDKMGGMTNIIANLLAYRRPDAFSYHAVLTHNHLHFDTLFTGQLAADTQTMVEYTLPIENLHAVMRRVARAVPPGGGVYVAGDLLDLAVASAHDFGRAVVHILHGDIEYYYDLAVRHDPIVHAYVTYSRRMYEELRSRLPHRAGTIFHLPYGIPLPLAGRRPCQRAASSGLRRTVRTGPEGHLRFAGDRPRPAGRRRRGHLDARGRGPRRRRAAASLGVQPRGPLDGVAHGANLSALYQEQDVFVLPTRFEGFPVALLEAMASGLPPIVSDIASGVPEIVESGVHGERLPVGDVRAFAGAIARLDRDRGRLEAMSAAARQDVARRFDVRDRVADYQALYARWQELYRPLGGGHLQYGSRLDQPWIPNPVVRLVRTAIRLAR